MKLQYFGHLMRRVDSLEKTLMLGGTGDRSHNTTGKESACNSEDLGSIPGLGRCLGEGSGYPLQYSGLQNSMNCIAHGVIKSLT